MSKSTSLKPLPGAPVPLFDRLVDEAPFCDQEAGSFRVLDRDGLVTSVKREVHRLLGTRSSTPMSQWEARDHSVLDYGLPDFTHLSPRHGEHREQLARIAGLVIDWFEPRLGDVHLHPLVVDGQREQVFRFRLEANLICGKVIEPISFPLAL